MTTLANVVVSSSFLRLPTATATSVSENGYITSIPTTAPLIKVAKVPERMDF